MVANQINKWLVDCLHKVARKQFLMLIAKEYALDDNNQIMITSLDYKRISLYAGLIPVLMIAFDILFDNLGSNPQQALHIRLGDWALRFLCITLLITPVQTITRWRGLTKYRQLFGLFSFFYATLHLIAYLLMDHALVWNIIIIDITESAYIWYGAFAYVIIFLLAVTSPDAVKKTMGKSWKKLHRWIYPASIAVLIHYFWQLKGNLLEPVFYASIIFILLFFRVLNWFKDKQIRRLMIPKGPSIIE